MSERWKQLKEKASKATPGPWRAVMSSDGAAVHQVGRGYVELGVKTDGTPDSEDAEYIAACSPTEILELIAERDRLEQRSYPHMCRDEHDEIGFRNSEIELCPVCEAKNRAETAEASNAKLREQVKLLAKGLRDIDKQAECAHDEGFYENSTACRYERWPDGRLRVIRQLASSLLSTIEKEGL